jgi:hypothetical protein
MNELQFKTISNEMKVEPITALFPDEVVYAVVIELFHDNIDPSPEGDEFYSRISFFSTCFRDWSLPMVFAQIQDDATLYYNNVDMTLRIVSIVKCEYVMIHDFPNDEFKIQMSRSIYQMGTLSSLMSSLNVIQPDGTIQEEARDQFFIPFIGQDLSPKQVPS